MVGASGSAIIINKCRVLFLTYQALYAWSLGTCRAAFTCMIQPIYSSMFFLGKAFDYTPFASGNWNESQEALFLNAGSTLSHPFYYPRNCLRLKFSVGHLAMSLTVAILPHFYFEINLFARFCFVPWLYCTIGCCCCFIFFVIIDFLFCREHFKWMVIYLYGYKPLQVFYWLAKTIE